MDLDRVAHEINTQDNRITQDPLFCVFEKERIYGVEDDYTDQWEWCNSDQQCHCASGEACESKSEECRKVGYIERNHFVNAHFTERAAKEHIRINGHNLYGPFVYVTSLFRCEEMIAIRNTLANKSIKSDA